MRLLEIFNRYLQPGGEEFAVNSIHENLTHLAEVRRCHFRSAEWKEAGAPPQWKQPFLMYRNPAAIKIIEKAHQDFHPDYWVVHNVFPVASAGVFEAAKRLNVKIIYFCHNFRPFSVNGYCWAGDKICSAGLQGNFLPEVLAGSWQGSRLKTAIFALVLKKLLQSGWLDSVYLWLGVSDFVRSKFVSAGLSSEKVHALRHCWEVTTNQQTKNRKSQYLFMGRLSKEKGIPVLLDAWKELKDRLGASCPDLVICGEGPLNSLVQSVASSNPKIRFLGFVSGEEKSRLLSESRALIVPSVWWEALGMVAYEAYDHSTPVLAADSGGLKEVVLPNETGLLHEPGNSSQLADQIAKLEQNPDFSELIGKQGRHWLENNCQPHQWRNQFLSILQERENACRR